MKALPKCRISIRPPKNARLTVLIKKIQKEINFFALNFNYMQNVFKYRNKSNFFLCINGLEIENILAKRFLPFSIFFQIHFQILSKTEPLQVSS